MYLTNRKKKKKKKVLIEFYPFIISEDYDIFTVVIALPREKFRGVALLLPTIRTPLASFGIIVHVRNLK